MTRIKLNPKRTLSWVLTLMMVLTMMPAMTLTASATGQSSGTVVDNALDNALTAAGFDTSWLGNTVTVTGGSSGSPIDCGSTTLLLTIPAAVTVDWQAYATFNVDSSNPDGAIKLSATSEGTFHMTAGALKNIGDTGTLLNNNASAEGGTGPIKISGGTMTAVGGCVLSTKGSSQVDIFGTAELILESGDNKYCVVAHTASGTINVYGDAQITADGVNAVGIWNFYSAGSSAVNVSGNAQVTVTGANTTAIVSDTAPVNISDNAQITGIKCGIHVYGVAGTPCPVNISGGTISSVAPVSDYENAIFFQTSGTLTMTGGMVINKKGLAIRGQNPANDTYSISGDAVIFSKGGMVNNPTVPLDITPSGKAMVITWTVGSWESTEYTIGTSTHLDVKPASATATWGKNADGSKFGVNYKDSTQTNIGFIDIAGEATIAVPNFTLHFNLGINGLSLYKDDATEYTEGKGTTWSVDAATNKLNLNNFNFATSAEVALVMDDGTTLALTGTSSLVGGDSSTADTSVYGIYGEGDLTIQGTGVLNVDAGDASGTASDPDFGDCSSVGIFTNGKLTITGGTLHVTAGDSTNGWSEGIWSADDCSISGGEVHATGGTATDDDYGYNEGFYVEGDFNISGGTVYATGGAAEDGLSSGVYIEGDCNITGGTVYATGEDQASAYEVSVTGYYKYKQGGYSDDLSNGTSFPWQTDGNDDWTAHEQVWVAYDSTQDPSNSNKGSGGSGGGGSSPAPTPPTSNVIVDGKQVEAGKVEVKDNTTTVTVNQETIQKQLETANNNVTVVVPAETGTAVAQLVVQNVDDMAAKSMTLTVQVGNVQYELPTTAVDTSSVLAALGATNAADVPISISVTTDMSPAAQTAAGNAVVTSGGELVIPPIEFKITATYDGKTVEITTFSQYVSRSVEITAEQAAKITTALVVELDGTTRHVPTYVYQEGGKWYANINSLTNSTYALIYNEATFGDVAGKWYESAVNEMASRMVISGVGNDLFAGERAITRAEFAAIIVKALGLPTDSKSTAFSDVSASAWYSGAVGKAYEYNIVSGVGNGKYDPQRAITRQEAMLMTERAAKIAGFTGSTSSIGTFSDNGKVSGWALDAAEWNVGSGLIVGSNGKLNPLSNITRAETATLALKLVQKAELVDVRTKF